MKGTKVCSQYSWTNGADIEATDYMRYTPLMRAVRKGHKTIVEILLNRGADTEAKSDLRKYLVWSRMKAVHMASAQGHHDIEKLLKLTAARRKAKRSKERPME